MTDIEDIEVNNDLFWHALNYRGASYENAPAAWLELEACVNRLVALGETK